MLSRSIRSRLMYLQFIGLSLSMCAAHGFAQEAAYVDTRGSSGIRRPAKTSEDQQSLPGKSCGDDCTLEHPLALQLVKLELSPQSVEWTIRIGNQSGKSVRLPTSTMRSETTVESAPGHKVVSNMSIVASLSCASSTGIQRVPLEIDLYGAPDGSIGMTTIDPGQWMTIVGRADTCADPGNDRVKDKEVEEVSPVYEGASSGSVLWDGHGELASHNSPSVVESVTGQRTLTPGLIARRSFQLCLLLNPDIPREVVFTSPLAERSC
jgi:hypothetical protein